MPSETEEGLQLEQVELLELLLAQERVKTAELTIEVDALRWQEMVAKKAVQQQQQLKQLKQARQAIVDSHEKIERRLGISLDDYTFDDITGQLNRTEE